MELRMIDHPWAEPLRVCIGCDETSESLIINKMATIRFDNKNEMHICDRCAHRLLLLLTHDYAKHIIRRTRT